MPKPQSVQIYTICVIDFCSFSNVRNGVSRTSIGLCLLSESGSSFSCPGNADAEVAVATCHAAGADSNYSFIDVGESAEDLSSLSKGSRSGNLPNTKPCDDVMIVDHPVEKKPVRRRAEGGRVLNCRVYV